MIYDSIFRELSPTDIKILAYDIAQGMEYLHRLKPVPVIHRDLNRWALFQIFSAALFKMTQGDKYAEFLILTQTRTRYSEFLTVNSEAPDIRKCKIWLWEGLQFLVFSLDRSLVEDWSFVSLSVTTFCWQTDGLSYLILEVRSDAFLNNIFK